MLFDDLTPAAGGAPTKGAAAPVADSGGLFGDLVPAQATTSERGMGDIFGSAISRGWSQNVGLLTEALPALAYSVAGNEAEAQRKLGEYQARLAEIAKTNPAVIESFSKIGSLGDAVTYLAEAVGENLPSMVPGLGGAGLGALAGRTIAKSAAGTAAGMTAGAVAGSAVQNIPETFADVAQETGQQRPGVAMAFGGLKAGLDAIPSVMALKRAFGPAITDKIAGNILKRMGVGAAEQFAAEGATEAGQEALDIAAARYVDENRELFTKENLVRIADAGLKGGLGGATLGGLTGAIQRPGTPTSDQPGAPDTGPVLSDTHRQYLREMGLSDQAINEDLARAQVWAERIAARRAADTEPFRPSVEPELPTSEDINNEPSKQERRAAYRTIAGVDAETERRANEAAGIAAGEINPAAASTAARVPPPGGVFTATSVGVARPGDVGGLSGIERLTQQIGANPAAFVQRTLGIPESQFRVMPQQAQHRLLVAAMEQAQVQQPGPTYQVQDTSGQGPTSAAPAPMREARRAPYVGAAENPVARVQPTSAEIEGAERGDPDLQRFRRYSQHAVGGSERPFPAGPDSSGLDFGNRRSWGAPRDPEAEFFERRANEMAARAKAAQQEQMRRRQEAYNRWKEAAEARQRAQNEEDLRRRYSEGQQYRDYEGAYREQTGQSRWGNADYSFKQGKYTPHPKPFDAEGNYPVDENGFVTSTGGGPIVFPTQKAAGRWILDHGNKRGRQVFEPANHPGVNGKFTVYQRGMTEPEQGPGPESGGAGPSASSASSARPALAPPVGPNQTQTPGRPSPGQAEGPSPEPTAAAPGAAPVSPDAPQPAPDSPRGPAATKPKTKAAPGTKKTQTEKAPTQPQTFPNESAGSYEDLRNQYSQDTGMSGEPRVAMDWLIRKGKETGNEHIVIVDKNGRVLSAGTANKPKEVAISAAGKNAMAVHGSNLVMHHNHPVETALSRTDTRVATLPGVRWVVAYTPTGLIDAAGPSEKLSAFMKTSSENTLGKIRTGISNAIDGVTSRIAELAGPLSRRAGVVIPDDEYRQSQIVQVLAGRTLERAGLINHIYTIPIDKKLLDAFERHEKEMANEIIRQFVQVLGFDGNSELFDRPTPQVSTNRALAAFSEGHAGLGSDTERAGAERGDRGGAGGFDATYPDRLEDVVPVPDINQQSILEEARNTTTGPSWFERGLPPIEAPMPKGKRSYTTYWTEWKDAGDGYASRAGINLPRLEIRTPEGDVVVRGWGTDGVEYNEIETGGWPTGERLRQVEDRMQALRDRAMRPKVQGKFAIGSRPSETRAGSSSGNENVGATIQTRPETSQQRAQATESLRQILRKLAGDKVDVKVVDRIVGDDANFADAGGFYTADEGRRIIYIAMAEPNEMAAVLRHETIHALRDLGIIQPKDWRALENQAAAWRKKYEIDKYYGGLYLGQELLNEEAIAEAYADWMRGRYQPTSVIENVFKQIRAFFEALRNWAQGNGWNTAEDVFSAIEGGEMSKAEFNRTPLNNKSAFSPEQQETATFKNWFGGSKVTDESGKPLRVYHGTRRWDAADGRSLGDFDTFDRDASVKMVRRQPSLDTVGSWFSDSSAAANQYAGDEGALYPVYLSIKNPATFTFNELIKRGQKAANWKPRDARGWNVPAGRFDGAKLREALQADGYDGVHIRSENLDGVLADTWIAFEPEQIKSATGNTGAFNPADKRMAFALSRAAVTQQANGVLDMIKSIRDWSERANNPLASLPDWESLYEQRGLAKGKIQAIQNGVATMRDIIGLKGTEREEAMRFMTTAGASPSMIKNDAHRAKFVEAKKKIIDVGRDLVDVGLLPEDVYRKNKGAYLPRMYLKFLLEEDADRRATGGGSKPGQQNYLKHRKDIPEDIRKILLGEIDDPGFLAARAISVISSDLAKLQLLQHVAANPKWTPDAQDQLVEWRGRKYTGYGLMAMADDLRSRVDEMPESRRAAALKMAGEMDAVAREKIRNAPGFSKDYKQVPDTKRWGALRGLWVRKEIYDDMQGTFAIPNPDPSWPEQLLGMGGWGTKLTQAWKTGKVVLNPPSVVRNLLSGVVQANVFGEVPIRYIPTRYMQAMQDIAKGGKYWQIYQKYGGRGSAYAQNEMAKINRDFLLLQKALGGTAAVRMKARFKDMIAVVADKASDAYQLVETIGKVAVIIDAMERAGLNEGAAVRRSEAAQFDYSNVQPWMRYLRNSPVGVPFITYAGKVLPQLLHTAVTRPMAYTPYIALAIAMPMLFRYMTDIDEEEWERLKKVLPQWARESGVYILPIRDSAGRWHYLDMNYIMPWGMLNQAWNKTTEGKPGEALKGMGLFGAPLFGIATAITTGIDPFTNRPITQKGDPPWRQYQDTMLYAMGMAMPPWLALGDVNGGWAKKLWQAANNEAIDRRGNPTSTMTQALGRVIGINLYGLDPEVDRDKAIRQKKFEIDEIKRRRGAVVKDQRLKPAEKKEYLDDLNELIREKSMELQAYTRDTVVSQKLRVQRQP